MRNRIPDAWSINLKFSLVTKINNKNNIQRKLKIELKKLDTVLILMLWNKVLFLPKIFNFLRKEMLMSAKSRDS